MKTYLISRSKGSGRSLALAVVSGRQASALPDAMEIVKFYNKSLPGVSHHASDTDWTEISIMGKHGTDEEYSILWSGHVLDFPENSLPDGFYESVFNPNDLRDRARRYEVYQGKLCYRPA
jgi:hypothetical protein